MASVFLSFLVFATVRSPVPGVNEPHYLSKAKHYWNPDWCRGDFFLESSDAHLVFYQTVGWLTLWLTLEQTAWVGRVAAWLLLAGGWTALVSRLVAGRWAGLWAAWTFLGLAALGNFSGEWLVGGVEAKVFSYALVFWSLAAVSEGRWNRAAVCAGLAVSFHPVVGIWSLAAGSFAGIVRVRNAECGVRSSTFRIPHSAFRTPLTLLGVCSLPGLIPAMAIIGSSSPKVAYQADYIQVFYRLAHHLDPMKFPMTAYLFYAGLTIFWLIGRRWAALTEREMQSGKPKAESGTGRLSPFAFRFVVGAVLIAAVGFLVGYHSRQPHHMPYYAIRMKLMKFYPFRLFDVMTPLAASVVLVGLAQTWLQRVESRESRAKRVRNAECGVGSSTFRFPHSAFRTRSTLPWVLFGSTLAFALLWPAVDRNPSKMSERQLSDWRAACRWIAEQTPADALFLTPPESWAFKWYAERAEFVAHKDCPQDAAGIVEWNRRLRTIGKWDRPDDPRRFSNEYFQELQKSTGVTHILAQWLQPTQVRPIYANTTYKVFRIERGKQ